MSTNNFLTQGGVMKQKFLSFFVVTVLAYVSASFTETAQAGRYELIKGKGVEVCEAYEKNLNSMSLSTPMLCERPVNPNFKDFAKPAWEKLTLDQIAEINVDVADRMLSMATPNSEVLKQPKSERIRKAKELTASAHNESWPLSVLRAAIDLDNNGKPESFVKDIHGKCDKQAPLPSIVLRPIGEDATNTRLTEILQGALHRDKEIQYKTGSGDIIPLTKRESLGGFMYPDVFRYKNEWYLDVWATERGPNYLNVGRLHVFQHKNGKTVELCEFDFRGNAR